MVDLLMALLSLTLAVALGVLARRHFLGGRRGRGWVLVAGAVTSGAVAELWVICMILGVPPFFMGEIKLLPCDPGVAPERGIVLNLSSILARSTTQSMQVAETPKDAPVRGS